MAHAFYMCIARCYRSSARTLLGHPFITENHDERGNPIEDEEFEPFVETSSKSLKRQFRHICKELYAHYKKVMKKEFKSSRAPYTPPKFKPRNIRLLAKQIGVENDFAMEQVHASFIFEF